MEWVSASLIGAQLKDEDHTFNDAPLQSWVSNFPAHQNPLWESVKQGTQSWSSGATRVGRKVGTGFRMGEHVCPRLIHVNVWQKPPQLLVKELSSN